MRNDSNPIYHIKRDNNEQPAQQHYYFSGQEKPDSKQRESELNKSKPAGKQVKKIKPLFSPKGGPIPFILTPPKLEDRHIRTYKEQPSGTAIDKALIAQPKPRIEKGQTDNKKSVSIPKRLMAMLTPFSPMLSWSPSLPSKFSNSYYVKANGANSQPGLLSHFNENDLPLQKGNTALVKEEESQSQFSQEYMGLKEGQRVPTSLQQENQLDLKINPNKSEVLDLVHEFSAILEASNESKTDLLKNEESSAFNDLLIDQPKFKKMGPHNLVNEFKPIMDKGFLLNEESKDEGLIDESSGTYYFPEMNNDYSLESKFVSMLEESSSFESSSYEPDINSSIQDQVFSLIAEYSLGGSESSSFFERNHAENDVQSEESSSSDGESRFSFECQTREYDDSSENNKELMHDVEQDGLEECSYDDEFTIGMKNSASFLHEQVRSKNSLQEKLFSLMEEISYISDQVSAIINEESTSYRKYKAAADDEKYQKISSLLRDFSAKLEDNASINDGDSDSEEINNKNDKNTKLFDKFSSELDSTNIMDASEDLFETGPSINESSKMCDNVEKVMEEEMEEKSYLSDQVSAIINEESTSFGKYKTAAANEKYQKPSSLLRDFSAKLEDSSSINEGDSDSEEINNNKNDKITKFIEKFSSELDSTNIVDASEDLFETGPSINESSNMCDNVEKVMEEESEVFLIDHHSPVPSQTGPIVKVPVLVAKYELEINLFECLPTELAVKEIKKLEWSVESLRCKALLPSNTVLIKGVIMARIIYENHDSLQMVKIPLPIDCMVDLCWLLPPMFPEDSANKEFMFQSENGCDFHHEFFQQFTEEIFCQLEKVHVVWHENIGSDSRVEILGNAILRLDFFQKQYVSI